MSSRRRFVQTISALLSSAPMMSAKAIPSHRGGGPFMPDEGAPHKRTWMAFGAELEIWGEELLTEVQHNLAAIARVIAQYEPVSMLVREHERALARELAGPSVELINQPMDDLWIRDTGPVFVVTGSGRPAAVNFNFNAWGNKQPFTHDAEIAEFVSARAGVKRLQSKLVLEGGGIEVDGHGTAIIAESCVLNPNRNPGLTKTECELALNELLGLEHIIWLPGIRGKDITDGHTDFYARFAHPGVVVAAFDPDPASFDHSVTKRHLEILRTARDARGRRLKTVVIQAPTRIRKAFESDDFAAGYINYYLCNGAVIAPEFGDRVADLAAKRTLKTLFPDRDIVQLNIDAIAAGGGGIHCATQQEPALGRPLQDKWTQPTIQGQPRMRSRKS